MNDAECIYCGQALEVAEDGALVDVESGRSGCGAAVDAGEADGEHVADESNRRETG